MVEFPAIAAMRALRDCGTIRVTIGHVPVGYRRLQAQGLVTARAAGKGKADVRLNGRGAAIATSVIR